MIARGRRGEVGDLGAAAVLEVDDPRAALGQLAGAHRGRWAEGDAARRLIAITGSAGKTTTKELTRAALTAGRLDPRRRRLAQQRDRRPADLARPA
jgi:UDP-N-acetylmuramyl pentapeptide synthase